MASVPGYYVGMGNPRDDGLDQPIRQASQPAGCRAISMPFFLILLLIGLIATVAAVMISRNPGAFVASVWVEQIGKTTLPDEQKQHMVTVVFDVRDRLEAGDLTEDQARGIAKAIATDYGINAALFYYVADQVQRRPEYPGRDPEPMSRQLQRLTRGVVEGLIDGLVINEFAPIVSHNGRPKPTVSAADLEGLRERAEALADAAGVTSEAYHVDAGALFEAAVDRALAAPAPAQAPDQKSE